MLSEINCGRVPYCAENNIDVHISHRHPLFHDPLLEVSDGHPQCVFLIFMYQFGEVVEDVVYSIHILLGFFWILCSSASGHSSSSSSSKSIMGGASSEAMSNHDVLDTKPKEGGNLVGTSKTRFRMVFLVGTAAYIGPMTLIHKPHPG